MEDFINKIESRSAIVGVAGIFALVASFFVWNDHFFRSYLFGYLLWVGLTLGCLGILILHHLVSGAWGHVIQRIVESGAKNLPAMAILFVPIILGAGALYPWTDHAVMESSHVLEQKAGYLNLPFFIVRAVFYFAFWTAVASLLSSWSRKQDESGDASLTRRMRFLSGPALVAFVITVTLASVDWMMSLEPKWYSTIYGMGVIVGMVLTALSFCIVLLARLSRFKPYSDILTTRHAHHLGNLLFAFTILWAYMAFSQYLIIWSGNLPEDNFWYLRRTGEGWITVATLLLFGHFFVPFLILLSRKSKRVIARLQYIAGFIFLMRLLDIYWLVAPAFDNDVFRPHILDLLAPVALGGIWLTLFMKGLKKAPILPLRDPRFGPDAFHVHDLD